MNERIPKGKKVYFINGRVPPKPFAQGGAEISLDIVLANLQKYGFDVHLMAIVGRYLSRSRHDFPANFSEIVQGVREKGIPIDCDMDRQVASYRSGYAVTVYNKLDIPAFLDELDHKNSILMSQFEYSETVIAYAKQYGIPAIIFVRDTLSKNLRYLKMIDRKMDNLMVIFNSQVTKDHYPWLNEFVKTDVIYPPIELDKYVLDKHTPKYVTMINPVKDKGGRIFEKIVAANPETQFLAVKGWYDPIVDGTDFSKYPNLTLWEKHENVMDVYNVTKLLLVPSQWKEAFARVGPEAQHAGIPVLASDQKGLRMSLGDGAWFVSKYKNPEEWIKSVESLISDIDRGIPRDRIERNREYVSRFDSERLSQKFFQLVVNLKPAQE